MNRFTTGTAIALVVCGAAALNAQIKSSDTKAKDLKPMMFTGCVMESGGQYMLDHAMMSADIKKTSTNGPASKDMMMSYKLMGGDLKAHVGHKVEVTAMMKEMPKEKAPAESSIKMGGTLEVTSVKMLSATCS